MAEPHLLISIPDKSFGFVPGQRIPIDIHVIGMDEQTVQARLAINDPLGATRQASGEVNRDLDDGHTVLRFDCGLETDYQPGTYLITAQVISTAQNFRAIATESFDVVVPGRRQDDGFPVAPRDRIVDANYAFDATDAETLDAAFRTAHAECEACRNADGGWGTVPDAEKPAYRWPSNVILGYLYGYEALGDEQYRKLAVGGLDYLLAEQDENGAFRWWYKGVPGGVMNQRDNLYDTGWAGLALAEGFRVTGEEEYLDAVRRAADWTTTCPFTGNNNYDAFALWFLSLLYSVHRRRKLPGDGHLANARRRLLRATATGRLAGSQLPYRLSVHHRERPRLAVRRPPHRSSLFRSTKGPPLRGPQFRHVPSDAHWRLLHGLGI